MCEMHCNKKYLQAAEDEVKHNMAEIAFRIAKSNVRDPHKKFMEDMSKLGRKSPKQKSHNRKAKRKHYSRK